MDKKIKEKLAAIEVVFMDVDGVLTDGSVIYVDNESPRIWNVKDRMAVKMLSRVTPPVRTAWISGRYTVELAKRGEELSVDRVFSGVVEKLPVLKKVLEDFKIPSSKAMYIGDDLVDLVCMKNVSLGCCPCDARREVVNQADIVASLPGGRGAVREIIEDIFKAKGIWKDIVKAYESRGYL